MSEQTNEFDQERQSLLVFIWKKRKIIILISVIAFMASLVVSLLMTPIFKSTAIVFPTATSTVSFSEQSNAKASSMDFGQEEHAEQLVQILQSSRIRNRVVAQFDLMKHYEIDENDENKYYKLGKAYGNSIIFRRTRYGSIQIDVFDRDAKLAADIANKIVQLIDTVKNEMIRERTVPAYQINLRKKNQLEEENEAILNLLDSLNRLGVVSIEGRANLFSAYNESKNAADKQFFKEQIDVNLKFGSWFDALERMRNEKIAKFSKFEDAYEQSESDANTLLNHKFIVEDAVIADKKDKPKRMIIVILGTMGAFIFSIFVLLILDKIKELRKA
tara:strand:+ start:5453 stop:6445 length:993 start_codon:yes stop_codon:yes gene_type:complete